MTHSALNGWFPFRKGACQMISPFWDILLVSIEWGRFYWKIVMRQRRLLSYEYITRNVFYRDTHSAVSGIWIFYRTKRYCHPCNWSKVLRLALASKVKILSWKLLGNIQSGKVTKYFNVVLGYVFTGTGLLILLELSSPSLRS